MKKRKLFLSILIINASLFSFAQKENNTWMIGGGFGDFVGIDFNQCNPSTTTHNENATPFEGQSAISDEVTGALLFYTDGYNIYDTTGNIMQNGGYAGMNNNLTQTIIIKKPGSANLFYMFTPDLQGGVGWNTNYPNARGVNYAEIDMSLNGGLGEVTSVFNSLKDTSNTEKMIAVYHSNGTDVWLIGHEYGSNNFFSFLITSSGISPQPIISSTGAVFYTPQSGSPGLSRFDAVGEMKASPDGSKLAYTSLYNGISGVADFDNSTGIVSNALALSIESGGYGVSFSQDNSKLYISGLDSSDIWHGGKLYQFDVSTNNQTTIQNSRTTIFTDSIGIFRSLKLAPNGKIYISRSFTPDYLGVINQPNLSGVLCNYTHDGFYLNGMHARWGLNNSIEGTKTCGVLNIEQDVNTLNTFSIYPNPFNEKTTINLGKFYPETTILIYNSVGQIVRNLPVKNTQIVDLYKKDLSSGIYYIQVNTNTYNLVKKIIIK